MSSARSRKAARLAGLWRLEHAPTNRRMKEVCSPLEPSARFPVGWVIHPRFSGPRQDSKCQTSQSTRRRPGRPFKAAKRNGRTKRGPVTCTCQQDVVGVDSEFRAHATDASEQCDAKRPRGCRPVENLVQCQPLLQNDVKGRGTNSQWLLLKGKWIQHSRPPIQDVRGPPRLAHMCVGGCTLQDNVHLIHLATCIAMVEPGNNGTAGWSPFIP